MVGIDMADGACAMVGMATLHGVSKMFALGTKGCAMEPMEEPLPGPGPDGPGPHSTGRVPGAQEPKFRAPRTSLGACKGGGPTWGSSTHTQEPPPRGGAGVNIGGRHSNAKE